MLALNFALPTTAAQAQFVCDSAAAGESGAGAVAVGGTAVACGTNANADGGATAVGSNAQAGGLGTAIGINSKAGLADTAIGESAGSFGGSNASNTWVGSQSGQSVVGNANVGIGLGAGTSVTGNSNSAIGDSAGISVTGSNNTAFGLRAGQIVTGSSNVAIGHNAGSGVLGSPLTANDTVSIGTSATASKDSAIAIGKNANASHTNSVAIGAGATTTRDNQQMFGSTANTYTFAGLTSNESKTAQGVPTSIVTSNAAGDLAAHTFAELGLATTGDISAINSQLATINSRLDSHDVKIKKATEGVAMAFAMAGVPTVLPHEKVALTANWGTFEGENALSLGAAVKLDQNWQLNAGYAGGTSGQTHGGRVGVRVGW